MPGTFAIAKMPLAGAPCMAGNIGHRPARIDVPDEDSGLLGPTPFGPLPLGIEQWCAPLRLQHAGRLSALLSANNAGLISVRLSSAISNVAVARRTADSISGANAAGDDNG